MPESFSFLPTNLSSALPVLVRVDAELRPELLRYTWQYVKRTGRVIRRNVWDNHQVKDGARVLVDVPLERVIWPADELTHIGFLNGDCLDFRRDNLFTVLFSDAKKGVEPGSTFASEASYREAVRELHERLDYYRAESKSSRNNFSIAKTREVLDYIKEHCAGWGFYATAAHVCARLNDMKLMSPFQIHRIIQGKSCHVPGYDYAALAATRTAKPGRPART